MKFIFVFVAIMASVIASEVADTEHLTKEQFEAMMSDNTMSPEARGLILNSQAKKAVRNIQKQMPCGWPERGIPPMAPYTNEEVKAHVTKSVVDSIIQMIRFRFDGLDDMEIKKLKVSYTFNKKVKFHFNFKELKAKASLMTTDTFVDLMKQMGIAVRYQGSGPMEFALQNLSLQGQFKYKMPFIFGSIKIYKFECYVTLGGVRSRIGGVLGNGKWNQFINEKIEDLVPTFINGHQTEISDMIEDAFVPRINAKLKGNKFWSLLGMLGSSNSKCEPTPPPF